MVYGLMAYGVIFRNRFEVLGELWGPPNEMLAATMVPCPTATPKLLLLLAYYTKATG